MSDELSSSEQPEEKQKVQHHSSSNDTVYAIGLIGAWIFYIGRAGTIQEGMIGFLKGLVWPAFLVHGLLKFLDEG